MADSYEKAAEQRAAGIVPAGTGVDAPDPALWMSRVSDIKGAPQVFQTLEELVAFHPNKMIVGMRCNVLGHTRSGEWYTPKEFILESIPDLATEYPLSVTETDANHFEKGFWLEVEDIGYPGGDNQYQYAPDYLGGIPAFPYIESDPGAGHPDKAQYDWEQANWLDYDVTKAQTWVRFRTSAVSPWSIPLPLNAPLNTDDYVWNAYVRSNTIPDTPPRTINGIPNNYPELTIAGVGQGIYWADKLQDAPGTGPLYEIRVPKSVYGVVKGFYIGPFLIPEGASSLNIVRYSASGLPHPDTLVGTTETISAGNPQDLLLETNGWEDFADNDTSYMAIRQDLGGGVYSTWTVRKTTAESGEYPANMYKLVPANITPTALQALQPTEDFPQGWSDGFLPETDNLVNAVIDTIKYFNGVNKKPWSVPKIVTAKPVYVPYITSDFGDTFKYSPTAQDETPVPDNTTDITLTAHLKLGNTDNYDLALPVDASIGYQWTKVYDLDETGITLGTARTQVVNYQDMRGIALYKVVMTITQPDTTAIVQEATFEIRDNSDGIVAKVIELVSDPVYLRVDSNGDPIGLTQGGSGEDYFVLRALNYNVVAPAHTWVFERETTPGSDVWVNLTTDSGYVTINQSEAKAIINMDKTTGALAAGNHFNGVTSVQYRVRYTPLTDTEPTLIDELLVIKLTPDTAGVAGEDAVKADLSNQIITISCDEAGNPLSGEEGGTYGAARVKTLIAAMEGLSETTFTIDSVDVYPSIVGPAETQIQYDSTYVSGNKKGIFITHWGNQVTNVKISINITITTTGSPVSRTLVWSIDRLKQTNTWRWVTIEPQDELDFSPSSPASMDFKAILRDTSNYDTGIPHASWDAVIWEAISGDWSGQAMPYSIPEPTPKDTLTITRANVNHSVTIRCQVQFANNWYEDIITINDRADGTMPIIYYDYGTDGPPVPFPDPGTWPTPTTVLKSTFEALPTSNATTTDMWLKQPGANSYLYAVGQYSSRADGDYDITWSNVTRYRGEKGDQGPGGDGFITLYKASNGAPALTGTWTYYQAINTGGYSESIPSFSPPNSLWAITGEFIAPIDKGIGGDAPIGNWQGPTEVYSKAVNGTSYYSYIAYASNSSGDGFSTTPAAGLDYIAFRTSTSPLTPVQSDFTGLWRQYIGGSLPLIDTAVGAGGYTVQNLAQASRVVIIASASGVTVPITLGSGVPDGTEVTVIAYGASNNGLWEARITDTNATEVRLYGNNTYVNIGTAGTYKAVNSNNKQLTIIKNADGGGAWYVKSEDQTYSLTAADLWATAGQTYSSFTPVWGQIGTVTGTMKLRPALNGAVHVWLDLVVTYTGATTAGVHELFTFNTGSALQPYETNNYFTFADSNIGISPYKIDIRKKTSPVGFRVFFHKPDSSNTTYNIEGTFTYFNVNLG